jgi:hypothetical protein
VSGLIFLHRPEKTIVAVDTLGIRPDTKKPYLFQSKIHHIPHLNVLVAGVGWIPLIQRWRAFMEDKMFSNNPIVTACGHAQKALTEAEAVLKKEVGATFVATGTSVYTFGYNFAARQMAGFLCDSDDGFQPKTVDFGWGLRPAFPKSIEKVKGATPTMDDPSFYFDLMTQMADEDQKKVGYTSIGGHVLMGTLHASGFTLAQSPAMPGYERLLAEMIDGQPK